MNDSQFSKVAELLASARKRVIIISAFCGATALGKLLDGAATVQEKVVYVRWRLHDIAMRATDPEIHDVAIRQGATLMCHNLLHAKVYIADDHALVGSANATNPGLGLTAPANIEVLTSAPADCAEIASLVAKLEAEAVPAVPQNISLDDEIVSAAKEFAAIQGCEYWVPKSSYKHVCAFLQGGEVRTNAVSDCFALSLSCGAAESDISLAAGNTATFIALRDHLHEITVQMDLDAVARFIFERTGDSNIAAAGRIAYLFDWIHHCSKDMSVVHFGTPNAMLAPWARIR